MKNITKAINGPTSLFTLPLCLLLLFAVSCSDDDKPTPDTGTTDIGVVDGSPDAPTTDGPAGDGPAADMATTDQGPTPDVAVSDKGPKPDHAPVPDLPGPSTATVVVTEFIANPAAVSDSKGEWVELYNAGTTAVDITGWTLMDQGSDKHVITAGDAGAAGLTIAAGKYVVLAKNTDSTTNGGVTVAYGYGSTDFHIANSADEIVLLDKSGLLVDKVAYTSSWGVAAGASMQLKDPTLDNNVAANWCLATVKWSGSAGDFGTPGAANVCATSTDATPADAAPTDTATTDAGTD
jgi:Lamin Tail Domain